MFVRGSGGGACRVATIHAALTLASMVAASGCGAGDGLDRRALSGDVSWEDRPLAKGTILFDPISESAGTAVGARIRDGRFAIPQREGAVPGSYTVRIYASSGVQAPPDRRHPENSPRPMLELIPDRYNRRSTLKVDVVPQAEAAFRFRLMPDPASRKPTRAVK